MIIILYGIVTISGGMLMIRIQIVKCTIQLNIVCKFSFYILCFQLRDSNNLMILITPLFVLFFAFVMVGLTCELAGRIAYRFDHMDDIIRQFKWYLFPLKIRKNLPTILINFQEAVYIECLGSIACDRATLKKVCQITLLQKINRGERRTEYKLE